VGAHDKTKNYLVDTFIYVSSSKRDLFMVNGKYGLPKRRNHTIEYGAKKKENKCING
jgi:hypothetical protein